MGSTSHRGLCEPLDLRAFESELREGAIVEQLQRTRQTMDPPQLFRR